LPALGGNGAAGVAVPEPATAGMLLVLLGAGLGERIRRRAD
jgi:hypothetical protein